MRQKIDKTGGYGMGKINVFFHNILTSCVTKKLRFSITLASLLLLSTYAKAQLTTLNVGGTTRSMFVHAPANIAQNRPLVISMHGLNQDINYQKGQAKWELVADTANFVVVYPAGINNSWDIGGTRDTDFISAIIDNMVTRYGIDRNRVYVSGFSMGGMMSYHTANTIADKVAAIGPVSGYLFSNNTTSSRPMPIIHVHGNADDVVRYEPFNNQQGVVAMLQKWRNWNQCPSTGTRTTPYPTNRPNSRSVMEYWGPCDKSAVALITLEGKGHWHSNDDAAVHTTIELWKFLKNFSLNGGSGVSIQSPLNNASFVAPAAVTITATASGSAISNVRFYNGNTLLNTDNTAPYSFNWTNVPVGTYTIRAVATDNEGNTTEDEITIRVNVPQGPYEGTVHPIPGTIQLEHFDVGGNGFAYFDDTPGSETDVEFRTDEDVDLEESTDAGGGYNLGWTTAGEWLEYTVNVATPGLYDLSFRAAVDGEDRTVSLSMDGEAIATNVAIPNTTGWQVWQTVTVSGITLLPGEKIMRLTIGETDYVNLNYVTFTLTEEFVQEPFNGTAHLIPGRIEAEDYDLGGEGLAYHEANSNGNEGGATYRTDEVDIEATQDTEGDYNLGYTLTGEWLEYTVNVLNSGNYDLDIRVAKDGDGGLFHIEIDGEDLTGAIEVPNTGGWQVWETITLNDLELTAGEHIMRIVFDTDYTNLNYVEFKDLVTGTGLGNNADLTERSVFPNPTKNSVQWSTPENWVLMNAHGQELSHGKGMKTNLQTYPCGLYFLKIEGSIVKVIKE